MTSGDSLRIASLDDDLNRIRSEHADKSTADTLNTDITTAFIGHSSEYSVYRKIYKDNIELSDENARNLYNNNFYLNPTASSDSSE